MRKFFGRRRTIYVYLAGLIVITAAIEPLPHVRAGANSPNLESFRDPTGEIRTFNATGAIDLNSAFFQSIGSNGRSCNTCHQPDQGWSVTPQQIHARFNASNGTDPIFRPNDGANCPTADVSTVDARRDAYSMLLTKGLIRVSMAIPANADFKLVAVDDPYNCATAQNMSLYRRPLPSTNLSFLSAVMWDGRETVKGQAIIDDLRTQAVDATTGHAQGATPNQQQVDSIVAMEMGLTTAQGTDDDAGELDAQGGNGGPHILSGQGFFIGINDPLGLNPTGQAFDPASMTLYKGWTDLNSSVHDQYSEAREQVARGEALFDSFPIPIKGVAGLNDTLNLPVVSGTCTTCHDSPNVGDHSISQPLNIGLVDASRRTPDLPLYTFQCNNGQTVQVTDPGRALISGKCQDIGKFKGPILRGLASRAPYFHNGSAATLMDAVNFYDTRFQLGLTQSQKDDLVAFLKTL